MAIFKYDKEKGKVVELKEAPSNFNNTKEILNNLI